MWQMNFLQVTLKVTNDFIINLFIFTVDFICRLIFEGNFLVRDNFESYSDLTSETIHIYKQHYICMQPHIYGWFYICNQLCFYRQF